VYFIDEGARRQILVSTPTTATRNSDRDPVNEAIAPNRTTVHPTRLPRINNQENKTAARTTDPPSSDGEIEKATAFARTNMHAASN